MRKIKEKLITSAMALLLVMTVIAGVGINSQAANTSDERYAYSNANASGCSSWRSKENSTKVYIHPVSGPRVYYTVKGKTEAGKEFTASSRHRLAAGTKASFTNHVNEWDGVSARLFMERESYVNLDTVGYWSPDSIGTYTIYN